MRSRSASATVALNLSQPLEGERETREESISLLLSQSWTVTTASSLGANVSAILAASQCCRGVERKESGGQHRGRYRQERPLLRQSGTLPSPPHGSRPSATRLAVFATLRVRHFVQIVFQSMQIGLSKGNRHWNLKRSSYATTSSPAQRNAISCFMDLMNDWRRSG